MPLNTVTLTPRDPALLRPIIGDERLAALTSIAGRMHPVFGNGKVVNVTEEPTAGALGEMLRAILGYTRGAGVTTEWRSLSVTPAFSTITRRLRDQIHGLPGDGGPLGESERRTYLETLRANFAVLADEINPRDIVILHDPGTAGLIPLVREAGGLVVWRCHAGADNQNGQTDRAWSFLEPFVGDAHRIVVNRSTFIPPVHRGCRVAVIHPSIDPCATRNLPLTSAQARAALARIGVIDGEADETYLSETGDLRPLPRMRLLGTPIPADARLVLQIGDWDLRSDMPGVLSGFAEHTAMADDVHLVLCGPENPPAVATHESQVALAACRELRSRLPDEKRGRIHLLSLPDDDADVRAHIVNALQVGADVIVQKSRAEGFSLTVAEAMWKRRPVIASGVGGINELIADERDGLLLGNPADLDTFGQLLARILADPGLAHALGEAAHTRIERAYLPDRHLIEYANLIRAIVNDLSPVGASEASGP